MLKRVIELVVADTVLSDLSLIAELDIQTIYTIDERNNLESQKIDPYRKEKREDAL